ncbi:MAG: hypothetical protein AAF337_13645, partial [Pseudomonadota bacterium]
MTDAAAVPPSAVRPGEAAQVPATPSTQDRQDPGGQGNAAGQGQTTAPSKSPPLPFREPAISLSPQLAGIKVGDVLTGEVVRIDAEVRAVVQNERQTLLVDPAASLKPTQSARITVTQVVPQFLGTLPASQPANPPQPVQLALVALRGLEAPSLGAQPEQTQGTPSVTPPANLPLKAALQNVNASQDVVSSLAAAPKAASGSTTAPILMQATATLESDDVKPNGATAAFIARHPGLAKGSMPLALTVLPASQTSFGYAKPPQPSSPIAQLINQGRAVLAEITSDGDTRGKQHPAIIARAGNVKITLPQLPDASLQRGGKIVLLSASATSVKETQSSGVPIQTGRGQAVALAPQQLEAPILSPVLAPVQTAPALPLAMGKLSQLVAYTLLSGDASQSEEASRIGADTSAAKEKATEQPGQAVSTGKKAMSLKALSDALAPMKQDVAALAPAAASGATPMDAPALPLVVGGQDTPLIASLFHW